MKPVWDAFLDLFSNFISFAQHAKTNKETLKEQRVKRDKEKKIFNSKKEFVRVHLFMTSAESLKFEPPTPLFPSMHKHLVLI